MPTDYFPNGSQQISQAIVFDDSRAKAIANMPDGSIRFVTNAGRPSVSEDLVWSASGALTMTGAGRTITAIGGQTNLVHLSVLPTASGAVQEAAFYSRIDGIATGGSSIFRIAGVFEAQTGGGTGANGVVGLNVTVQQNAADDVAFGSGLELAFNNLKRNDPLNPVDQNHYGMTLDVYGGFATGPAALAIRTGAVNSSWQRGLWIPINTITANGYAFDYEGDGNGAVRILANGTLRLPLGTGTGFVSAGAPDSGGLGFRLLVVPN
jgi:hypothetical protein